MQLHDLLQFVSTLEQLQQFPLVLCPVIQIDSHLVSDLWQKCSITIRIRVRIYFVYHQ